MYGSTMMDESNNDFNLNNLFKKETYEDFQKTAQFKTMSE